MNDQDAFHNPEALKQSTVFDRDGRRIGTVDQVYVEDWSRRPEWVTLRTDPDAAEHTFVPLDGAEYDADGGLRVAHTLDTVTAAPRMDAEQHLGLDQEQELYLHYGLATPQDEASGAPGVGADRPKAPLTGHEQGLEGVRELAEEPAAGAPRLRKFVPTDSDEATVSPSGVHGDNR